HRRLSIIDTSSAGNQPITDITKQYTIVFNGEIYNFKSLRKELEDKGVQFNSHTDTEVLLYAYIHWGVAFLERLQGFFAFAIYNKNENSLFLARDRFGIKPLLYYTDEDRFLFASEMKSILQYGIEKQIDVAALRHYLHLNYIPATKTIFKNIYKVLPGHYLYIKNGQIERKAFYQIPKTYETSPNTLNYEAQKRKVYELLEASVLKRLVADVPLGAFLSGGVDSSVVVALASKHIKNLETFSVGYTDNPFFDETHYAESIAKHFQTKHTTFKLAQKDIYDILFDVLDYIDEPFADSSALPVFILSKYVRKHVTVALSGDGADEMLGGYNKHWGEYKVRQKGLLANIISSLLPIWQKLPQSRNGFLGNKIRQFRRFAEGSRLSPQERYWAWAGFANEAAVENLLSASLKNQEKESYWESKKELLKNLKSSDLEAMNEFFYTDMQLVLPNDMLVKVDWMSMANSLEVRVPFLDHDFVNFIFSLPVSSKIDKNIRKKVLQDTFREMLPSEIYKRPKHGFEVPLLKWLQTDLRSLIENDLLLDRFVEEQGIFDVGAVKDLKKQLFSANPADAHARIWGLLVFQYWWKKYINKI
ncbi:MAG: asparagine synthase (glutamine-hydrolyzing), partial [Thermonemataceae bacterium]|nr:asparagine synthase (glutamine-hydrolyzing) [Thermonemataceae bacterium]